MEIFTHYLNGFQLFISIIFFFLAIFLLISSRRRAYHIGLISLLLVWGLRTLLPTVNLYLENTELVFVLEMIYHTILILLSFTIIMTVLGIVLDEDEAGMWIWRLGTTGITLGLVTGALFALTYMSNMVVDVIYLLDAGLLMVTLFLSLFLLIRHAKGVSGSRRFRINAFIFLLTVNIISYPISVIVLFIFGDRQGGEILENIILAYNGFFLLYLVLYFDPTEKMRGRFQRLENEFDSLMRNAGDGVALLDEEGTILFCNIQLGRMTGTGDRAMIGERIVDYVSEGFRPAVEKGLSEATRGDSARDIRHNILGSGEGGGKVEERERRLLSVVSTMSPVNGEEGEGGTVLMVTRDITPALNYEVERVMRARADAKNELYSILTSMIPLLLQGGGSGIRNRYLGAVLDRVERSLGWTGKNNEKRDHYPWDRTDRLANYLCDLMNDIGGGFYHERMIEKEGEEGDGKEEETAVGEEGRRGIDDESIGDEEEVGGADGIVDRGKDEGKVIGRVFYSMECPWGLDSRRNPILCNLCRGIFTRLIGQHYPRVNVDLRKTMGQGSRRCIITAHGMVAGKQAPKREDIGEQ